MSKWVIAAVHFFCNSDEKEVKNDESFVKPSLLVDGFYLNKLGFDFEFSNRMPVLLCWYAVHISTLLMAAGLRYD